MRCINCTHDDRDQILPTAPNRPSFPPPNKKKTKRHAPHRDARDVGQGVGPELQRAVLRGGAGADAAQVDAVAVGEEGEEVREEGGLACLIIGVFGVFWVLWCVGLRRLQQL